MTRIVAYPVDLGGCGHHRVIWPARALQAQGADIDLVMPHEPADRQIRGGWWDIDGEPQLVGLLDESVPDCDVIVMQRPVYHARVKSIPELQARGIRVVVEIDDDFDTIHPRNVAWRTLQPHLNKLANRQWLARACEIADHVVVSTPALARRYGAHGRVTVVRNCVPARYLEAKRAEEHDGVWVGWSGSVETHPADLQEMGGGFARALRATGAEFAVVGTGHGVKRIVGTSQQPLARGWVPIADYPAQLANFDVGVVPLQPGPFNEAKSYLTGLAMAACGVPFVASPTSEYELLVGSGNRVGALAYTPRDFERILKDLIRLPAFRADHAFMGREAARAHTIQGNADRWWDAWTAPLAAPVREVLHAR